MIFRGGFRLEINRSLFRHGTAAARIKKLVCMKIGEECS